MHYPDCLLCPRDPAHGEAVKNMPVPHETAPMPVSGGPSLVLLTILLASCAAPFQPEVPATRPEMLLVPVCRGDAIHELRVETDGAGGWVIPVEALRQAVCKGA